MDMTEGFRWLSMMTRCYDPRSKAYPDYGGRGIKVCERWHDYRNYFEDIGEVPMGLIVDRIDNDSDYRPDNVRLADASTSSNNRRNTKYYTYRGETKTLRGWSDATGLTYRTLAMRLRHGWSIENAIQEPVRESTGASQLSRETGIPNNTLHYRIKKGITGDDLTAKNLHDKMVEYNGETKSLTQWAHELGYTHAALRHRLDRGMSVEEAFTKPMVMKRKTIEYQGRKMTLKEWSQELDIDYVLLKSRIRRMTPEEAFDVQRKERLNTTKYTHKGETRTLNEWSDHLGISYQTLTMRLKKGWTLQDTLDTPLQCQKKKESTDT